MILLPDTDQASATLAAERLRSTIAGLEVDGIAAPVTASLGVATLHSWDADGNHLLQRADQALYLAKESGRNKVMGADEPVHVLAQRS